MSNIKVVEDFLESVWNLGHADQCDRFIADKYLIEHDPGDPWDGRLLTREEFKERVRISRSPCPDQRFTIVHAAQTADKVFVSWNWAATHQGEIAGFAPTGRQLKMSGVTIYFFSEGRISGHWQVVDRLGVAKQLAA